MIQYLPQIFSQYHSLSRLPSSICFYRYFCLSFQFCSYSILIHRILRQLSFLLPRLHFALCICTSHFVCKIRQNVLSSRSCCRVYLMLGIYELASSSVRYKIGTVYRLPFCFAVLIRIVPPFLLVLLLFFFLGLRIKLPILFFDFVFPYVFCSTISIVFFSSSSFSFITLSRSFVSVIAVNIFEMSRASAVILSNTLSF